jgi:hypothetical protein
MEQQTTASQVMLLAPVGEKAEGANPHQPHRQHVKQKTPNELIHVERHRFDLIAVLAIPVGESHSPLTD